MAEAALEFMDRNSRIPPRGVRIAAWVETHMRASGMSISELAFRIGADKRDVRRLLAENSCGPRLNDLLDAAFKHEFIDAVAAPLVGGDRITVLEREIASERARIASLDARLERETAARLARAAAISEQLGLFSEEDRGAGS